MAVTNRRVESAQAGGARLRRALRMALVAAVFFTALHMVCAPVLAAGVPDINLSITSEGGDQTSSVLQILFVFVIIALVPTVLLMMTSFTRIIIVMHFLRSALGTQQMPPNQVMVGIALILTLFIMRAPLEQIYTEAYQPYAAGEISTEEFGTRALDPLRTYMLTQVKPDDMGLFANIAGVEITVDTPHDDIPITVLLPAYMLTELKNGFTGGFWLYVPFIVIDMVVASVLMAMGMMMLPVAMVSMPFKLLLFVISDGWRWVIDSLVATFRVG